MEPVRADLDGIRATAELARRQAGHVRAAEDYLHRTCTASGAFMGVLGFFAGTYQSALDNAIEGLRGNHRTSDLAAESLDACATAYEVSDRSAYDALSRLAGGAGWEVDMYKSAGGGTPVVQGPLSKAAAEVSDASSGGGGGSGSGAEAAADGGLSVVAQAGSAARGLALSEAQKLPEYLTREVVMVGGRPVLKDDLPEGFEPTPDRIAAFNDRLDKIEDPFGHQKQRKEMLDAAVTDVRVESRMDAEWAKDGRRDAHAVPDTFGPGVLRNDAGHSYEDNARLHGNVRSVAGWYDDFNTAKGFAQDPLGDVDDKAKEFGAAVADVAHYRDVADDKVDSSALDWSARR